MGSFLQQPHLLRGVAIVLLAAASLLFLHHQAEHFGRAGDCPVCMQGAAGVQGLPSSDVALIPTIDLALLGDPAQEELPPAHVFLPSTSRAPPVSQV